MQSGKADIIASLQNDILRLQGFRPLTGTPIDIGLGILSQAFPNSTFPQAAVHEFLSSRAEDSVATGGFVSGLLASLMGAEGTALWISSSRLLFPPALKLFGVQPDRIVFIDLKNEKDVLWATEEALKCGALTAVVGELNDLSFTASRRLQLAVEQSRVTGFVLRNRIRNLGTNACVSRWKVSQLPSEQIEDLPGIGFPKWKVEILRMRNGKSGVWEFIWKEGKFHHVFNNTTLSETETRRAG
jgi:protein ImuA